MSRNFSINRVAIGEFFKNEEEIERILNDLKIFTYSDLIDCLPKVEKNMKVSQSQKSRLKLLFAFGTRPEAIKLAPLIRQALQCKSFDVKVVVTAQHREMLDQVLQAFAISPNYDLNLMGHAQGLNEILSRVLKDFDRVLEREARLGRRPWRHLKHSGLCPGLLS